MQAFGWASARFDDLINLPASRLSALLVTVAALLMPSAQRRQRLAHRTPRCRHTTARPMPAGRKPPSPVRSASPSPARAAMAASLVKDATMGEGGRRATTAADIRSALRLFWIADLLLVALIGLIAGAIWLVA